MRVRGAFRGAAYYGSLINCEDAYIANSFAGWTFGAAIVDTIQLPTRGATNSNWLITSVSVTGLLSLGLGGVNPFGKLSPIYAGVTTQGPQTNNPPFPFVNDITTSPLPTDLSLIGKLFDPESDPLPPSTLTTVVAVQVKVSVSPPNPIQVTAGASLYAGIWMPPSLLSQRGVNANIADIYPIILNAQYVIEYTEADTGQGPVPPDATR